MPICFVAMYNTTKMPLALYGAAYPFTVFDDLISIVYLRGKK
jgi:hypothetical protein